MEGGFCPIWRNRADWSRHNTNEVVVFFQAFESITVLFMVMEIMNLSMQKRC
jgi:hypothetical protein